MGDWRRESVKGVKGRLSTLGERAKGVVTSFSSSVTLPFSKVKASFYGQRVFASNQDLESGVAHRQSTECQSEPYYELSSLKSFGRFEKKNEFGYKNGFESKSGSGKSGSCVDSVQGDQSHGKINIAKIDAYNKIEDNKMQGRALDSKSQEKSQDCRQGCASRSGSCRTNNSIHTFRSASYRRFTDTNDFDVVPSKNDFSAKLNAHNLSTSNHSYVNNYVNSGNASSKNYMLSKLNNSMPIKADNMCNNSKRSNTTYPSKKRESKLRHSGSTVDSIDNRKISGRLVIVVTDSGAGISPDNIKRLFKEVSAAHDTDLRTMSSKHTVF